MFKRNPFVYIAIILCVVLNSAAYASQKRVLIIVSGYGNHSSKNVGYEFDELAKAYLVFKANSVAVDIASPQGGKITPSRYNPNTEFNQAVLNDEIAKAKIENTIAFKNVEAKQYQALFVVGGSGAMHDLPTNTDLQNIISSIYENSGTVSAVCHGSAALVNVKLSNGEYLVNNKQINSFTNKEEKILNKKQANDFDFLIEDKMKARGAVFESSPLLMSHVAKDKRLITGQNQHSTGDTAAEVVRSLGIENVIIPHFKDEKTMAVIRQYLEGDKAAINELDKNHQQYSMQLAGQYSSIYAKSTQDKVEINKAIELMKTVNKHWQHPRLSLSLASALIKVAQPEQAQALLTQVIADNDNPKIVANAKKLMNKINQQG